MAIFYKRHAALIPDLTRPSSRTGEPRALKRGKKIWRSWVLAPLAVLSLGLLAACDRDVELALRSKLEQWFYLRDTAFFASQTRCTGAMIHLAADHPRSRLPVQTNLDNAKYALTTDGVAAIRIEGMSPAELTDALLLSGTGDFGKQALAAGALAVSCFKGTEIGGLLHEALNRPGATLAYDMQSEGLMILDPENNRLFYVAGDVW